MKRKVSHRYVARMVKEGLGCGGELMKIGRTGRTGKRSGNRFGSAREREVELTMGISSFYSPYELLAKRMSEAIKKASRVSPVKQYPSRVGETHNLPDTTAQLRSVAAIFVKKYRFVSPSIAIYYAALRKRELTEEEAHTVVMAVSRLGKDQKDEAMVAWVNMLENGGEDARGLRGSDDGEDQDGGGELDGPAGLDGGPDGES